MSRVLLAFLYAAAVVHVYVVPVCTAPPAPQQRIARTGRSCTPQQHCAAADGQTIDTKPINQAIQECDTVTFTAASYLTGTMRLLSDTRIVFDEGASLLAAPAGNYDRAEAPAQSSLACVGVGAPYEPACQDYGHSHWADALITGANLTNISLVGKGVLDGNGNLQQSCHAAQAESRPGCKLVGLQSVQGLHIDGLSLRNGGHFTLLLTNVSDIHLQDLDIEAARDGIDLMGVRNLLAERLHIHGGGDDAFKLGSDWSLGTQLDSHNITLINSVLSSGLAQCIQFGTETSGNFDNMHFENISCHHAGKAGIGITSMDGANISNISFKNINLNGTTEPIHLYVGARAWQRRPAPYNVGSISGISFTNIAATNVLGHGPSLTNDTNYTTTMDGQGLSQNVTQVHWISDIHFTKFSIHYEGGGRAADAVLFTNPFHNPNQGRPSLSGVHGVRPSYGLFLRNLRDARFDNLTLSFGANDDRPAVILIDCHNVSFIGKTEFARGTKAGYDIGNRNSSMVSVEHNNSIRICNYPDCPSSHIEL